MQLVRSSDGVHVALHDLGGDGPPLLLTHATGFCGPVWRPVAERLADHFHCWAPDLRGHGRAETPEGLDYRWRGFADDVLAIVEHLRSEEGGIGDGPLLAAGHSKGGAALLLAEQRRPGTFAGLYCFEPVVFPGEPIDPDDTGSSGSGGGNHLAEGALRRRATFASAQDAYANFSSKPPLNVLHADALRAYVEGGFREEADGSVTLRCRPVDESQVYRMGGQHGAFAHLGDVAIPVTVATGVRDPVGPAAFAPHIAEALPHGELVVFDHLGHFGPLEDPDAVAMSILDALRP
ncbi:MAG: alpha/beta hydrolase [Acidimicrobiales bacterium]|nr:alpha/beta hydrolase [Acidimicrobiales bacterium]